MQLPIGGAAAIVFSILAHIRAASTEFKPFREKLHNLDAIGFVLFACSITMLLLALQWGGVAFAWSSSVIIGIFVGFAVSLALFIIWSIPRGEDALVAPRIFQGCTSFLRAAIGRG
jgi:hypothetical protein